MFCANCGKELSDGSKFCPACGRPIHVSTESDHLKTSEQQIKNSVDATQEGRENDVGSMDEVPVQKPGAATNSNHDSELSKVIGKNSIYYLAQFQKIDAGEKSKFNWAAFFLSAYFCLYRKCGEIFKKYFLIPLIIILIAPVIVSVGTKQFSLPIIVVGGIVSFAASIWMLINCIRLGRNFNAEYEQHCKTVLADSNTKKYGTSIISAILLAVIVLVVSVVIFVVSMGLVSGGISSDVGENGSNAISLNGEYAVAVDSELQKGYLYLDFNWDGPDTLRLYFSDDPTDALELNYEITAIGTEGTYSLRIYSNEQPEGMELMQFTDLGDDMYSVELFFDGENASGIMLPFTEENGFNSAFSSNNITEYTDISGDWFDSWSERCCMTITSEGDNYYTVDVTWSSSAMEYDEWVFSGYYDPSTQKLHYDNGNWYTYIEDPDAPGNIQEGCVLDNMAGYIYLQDNLLYWEDLTSVDYGLDFGAANMCFERS